MRKLVVIGVVVQILMGGLCEEPQKSKNMDPIDAEQWGLPPGHIYDKIFKITPKNHDKKIMESEDPWIVLFVKGKIHKRWRQLATEVGGAVWFGTVDVEKYPGLAKKVQLDMEIFNDDTTVAVVYPMHRRKKREAVAEGNLKSTVDAKQAELLASATIPDRVTDFTFSEEEQQKFNDWIVKGYYYEQPPKFPVICVTDDSETPIHIKILSHYMHTHFNFAVVRKVNVPAMRKLFNQVPEPQKYPMFFILLGIEPSSEEMNNGVYDMRFDIMPFLEAKYGDPRHIGSLLKFLFIANEDYRKKIPGRMPHEPPSVANMDGIRGKLAQRAAIAVNAEKGKKDAKNEL